MLTERARRYRWADEEPDLVWTVAVVEGRSVDDVLREYGAEPDRPVGEYTFLGLAEVQGDEDDPRAHLQVIVHNGLVLALEHFGWTGVLPGFAERCSAGGRFIAVHWSLSSNPRIVQAADGTLLACVELFAGAKPYAGTPAPTWLDEAAGVRPGELRSTALAFVERQTGVEVGRWVLDERRPAYRIPERP